MKRLNYTSEINASPETVYDTMLGLSDKKTYESWTAPFDPTSTWEGTWDEGGKITFTSNAKDNEKSGMVARILKNEPGKYVSIHHYGVLEKGKEITEGPQVEGWQNAMENYTFEPTDTGTKVKVEVDTKEEYAQFFDEAWPKALEKLKEVCEG